jgi:hypothetical protein
MCKDNTTVGGITLYVEDKGGSSLCIRTYTCAEREILYNKYQEMAIWKSIVTLIYKEFYLHLAGKYILKPCSGNKFSYYSKNRTLC